ncbi:hypothetical protein PsorP6_012809 [Peronosclerospora sorghi]|uniref:Uncharacterized protein n=1 Tax=Peronosclerospora sorghi TaxID=230839 RepID=A0ACC0WFD4_9STRA|nr:hypothetical protein PsorP6_012809 [Peronosclerospora sorghi]
MANSLSFLVLVFFAVSSIKADSKPNADAKHSHRASPGHDSTNKTVVLGNQMLRANDGADKVEEEERGVVQAWIANLRSPFQWVVKSGRRGQALKADRRPANQKVLTRQGLTLRKARPKELFKDGVSVGQLKKNSLFKKAVQYRQFLQQKKDTLDNLIKSSGKKHRQTLTEFLHDQFAGLLLNLNTSNDKLLFFRVDLSTVQAKGGAEKAKAYKKFLQNLKIKVKNLM